MPIEINKMNYNQRVAFNIIRDHFLGSTNDQLFMILTGLGGSGKSFVIQAVTNLLNEQCKVCTWAIPHEKFENHCFQNCVSD